MEIKVKTCQEQPDLVCGHFIKVFYKTTTCPKWPLLNGPKGGRLLNLPQSLEDIQKYLTNAWEGHIVITDCWNAANFENKQQTQLYVGKLTQQFLLDENDTVKSIELEELILKFRGGTDLEQPSIGNQYW